MNTEEFRSQGKQLIDFICEQRSNLSKQRVVPGDKCKVNFLKNLLSGECLSLSVSLNVFTRIAQKIGVMRRSDFIPTKPHNFNPN